MQDHNHRRILGVVSAAAAAAVYVILWVGTELHWEWLRAVDFAALDPLYDYGVKHPAWVRFWDVLCTVLGPAAFRILGIGLVVVAVLRRNLRLLLFIVFTFGVSGIVELVAKGLANRPRPEGAFVDAALTSFPSGHAVAVIAPVLALLTISAGLLTRRGRILAVVVGALIVVAVGAGRVVLNVHHPSDVVAGWALGYLWYLVCLLMFNPQPIGEAADETPQAPGNSR